MELNNCYCLTVNDDRYNYTCKIFEKYGLSKPKKFFGLTNEPNGPMACLIGHMSIVMMARCVGMPFVTIFEDDAYPRKDIAQILPKYIKEKPSDCGILCFGRNGQFGQVEENGNYICIKERPFGSHAYIIYKEAYDEYILSLEKQRIVDISLRSNNFKKTKCYWTKELLFVQKNIDYNCMSANSVKNRGRYFYPNPQTKGLWMSNEVPNEHFEEDGFYLTKQDNFVKLDPKNLPEQKTFVKHYSWANNCYVNTTHGVIIHGQDIGKLLRTSSTSWTIQWEKWPNAGESLVFRNGCYFIMKTADLVM